MKKYLIAVLFIIFSICCTFSACEVTEEDPHIHDYQSQWSYDEIYHWHKCSGCDEKGEKAEHFGGNATCKQKAVCEVCNQEYGDYAGHEYGETYLFDGEKHWKVCLNCNEKSEESAHSGGTATCQQKAECKTCGQEYGEIGKHDFADNGVCKHCSGTLKLIYTQDSPYEVKTVDDLLYIGTLLINDADLTDCYFRQTQNISLAEITNFTPIGNIGIPFNGIYDGNECEVTDLSIKTDDSYLGLFGFVTGTVKNLTVRGEIYGVNDGENNVGYAHTFAGGIVGAINNDALIENCVNYVNVTGDSFVGGIVGEIMETDYLLFGTQFATVKNCVNYGKVTAYAKTAENEDAMYYGGIAGRNNGYIIGCKNYGEVDGEAYSEGAKKQDSYVGGIAGYSYIPYKNGAGPNEEMDYIAISDCQNYGYVHGTYGIGGILGRGVFSLSNCINEGKVVGYNCVGGIIGIAGTPATLYYAAGTVSDCVNKGQVLSRERNAGGIVGYNFVTIENCENTAQGVVGAEDGKRSYYTAGIAGTNEGGKIISCQNYAFIKSVANATTVNGGIVGQLLGGTIMNCENHGNIEGLSDVGGIYGRDSQDYTAAEISGCNNYGNVTGTTFVGGVGGANYLAAVSDCTNDGEITATSDAGGIFGWLSGKTITIKNVTNEATAFVTTTGSYAGGIVGRVGSASVININIFENCINKGDVSGKTIVGGIVGGNADGMTTSASSLKITNCSNSGTIKGNDYIGGIIGKVSKSTDGAILSCINDGAVNGTNYRIAGIAGSVEPPIKAGGFTIDICVNNGNITSSTGAFLGGIVGMHGSNVYVRGCSNTGNITGVGKTTYGVGGISGSTYTSSIITSYTKEDGTVVKCSVSGTITGSKGCVGAIVGKNTKNTKVEADVTAEVVEL